MSRASFLATLGVALGSAAPISAQIGLSSSPQSVRLSAIKQGWVGISLPVATSAGVSGLQSSSVATSWNLDPELTATVTLVARFASGEGAIPALKPLGRSTPPPGAPAVPGSALVLFTQPIAVSNTIGTRTDGLEIRMDLPTPLGLPPDTHTGTLNLVAITQ